MMRRQTSRAALLAAIVLAAAPLAGAPAPADSAVAARLDRLVQRYAAHRDFHGVVLVAERGRILYQRAFGLADRERDVPNTLATRFGLASVSKQFTALLILQLVEEGLLDLDGVVTDYLPDYPAATGSRITIHHLLTHTSGIPQDHPTQGRRAARRLEAHGRAELRAYFQDRELLFEPGAGFQYSNFNYNLLAIIAESAAGTPYAEMLRRRVLAPAGMAHASVGPGAGPGDSLAVGYDCAFLAEPQPVAFTHESVALGAGDIYATAGDLFRWDRALYADALLPQQVRQLLFTPHTDTGYAYGWQVRSYPVNDAGDVVTAAYHDGGSEGVQCCIHRLIEDRRLIVVLSNHREPWIHVRLCRPREDMAPNIIRALYGGEVTLPGRSAAHALALAAEAGGPAAIRTGYEELRAAPVGDDVLDADEFYNAGLSYLWRSEAGKAYEFLRIAVDGLGVDHLEHAWQCHAVYGEAAFRCRRYAEAIPILERSLALRPDNPSASHWLRMARAYARR